jgi:hypothetical protein
MPYIEDEISKMKRQIEMRAMNAIRQAALTPDVAVSLWMEWHAVQGLHSRLSTKVIVGAQQVDALTGGSSKT